MFFRFFRATIVFFLFLAHFILKRTAFAARTGVVFALKGAAETPQGITHGKGEDEDGECGLHEK